MKKQNKKIQLNKPLLLISIILLATSLLINKATAIRIILWLSSILVLAINIKIFKNKKVSTTLLISLVLIFSSVIIDGIIVYTFKRIPVFSYSIITTENAVVYNSLGFRVWQCNKDNDRLIVNPFYTKGYMCNANDIDSIPINTFLNSVVANHSEYENNYVKLTGKISKKTSLSYLEMKIYTETDNKVNGYVEFSDTVTLKVLFNKPVDILSYYDLYDEITIVGIIKNIETVGSNYNVYMSDTEVVSSLNLEKYTLTVIDRNKCKDEQPIELYKNDTNHIYKYCLKDIIVTYPDNQYELASALSSNKLTIKELMNNPLTIEEDKETKHKIYSFKDYSILVCNPSKSKDIFIGPKKLKFNQVKCQEKVEVD